MIGGHSNQTHRVNNEFLHYVQSKKKICYINNMLKLVRSIRAISLQKVIKVNFSPDISLMRYERFFKQVQKAAYPWEAVKTYRRAIFQEGREQGYLPVTLRILTRLLRKNPSEINYIRVFIDSNILTIKNLIVQQLDEENLKDLLLFFQQFSLYLPTYHLKLDRFINILKDNTHQNHLSAASTIISTIQLTHNYFPDQHHKLIKIALDMLKMYPQKLIADRLTFINMIGVLRDIYEPSDRDHQEYFHCISKMLSEQDLFKYSEDTQIIILLSFRQINIKGDTSKQTKLILKKLQERILQRIVYLDQVKIQYLMSTLSKQDLHSSVLSKYYQLIAECVEQSGQCKINPRSVIFALSLLTKNNFSTYFLRSWEEKVVKMIIKYFGVESQFIVAQHKNILSILGKQLFKAENNQKLYEFYFSSFQEKSQKNLISRVFLAIQETYIHALYHQQANAIQSLKNLIGILDILEKVWFPHAKQRQKYFLININQILESIYGITNQQTSNKGQVQLTFKFGQMEKIKYFPQIKSQLFSLQLKLAYLNDKPELIPIFLTQLKQHDFSNRQLLAILKILLENPLSNQHYGVLLSTINQLFKDSELDPIQEIFNILYLKIKQDSQCSHQLLNLLTLIHSTTNSRIFQRIFKLDPVLKRISYKDKNGGNQNEKKKQLQSE